MSKYSNEQEIWIINGEIANSAGNLALHLCGNLKHFIGSTLAQSGYERNCSFEFEGKVSIEKLMKEVVEATEVVTNYLNSVSEEELIDEFPLQPLGY